MTGASPPRREMSQEARDRLYKGLRVLPGFQVKGKQVVMIGPRLNRETAALRRSPVDCAKNQPAGLLGRAHGAGNFSRSARS
jgi:hypothetical protein